MKIAFCTSVLRNNSKTRGVGVYTRELINALRKNYPRDQFIEIAGNPYAIKSDLVHYPFFDPFYLTLPWLYRQKTVITIHDLIPLKYPTHFKPGIRGNLKWVIQKYRASRADAILTDSQSSARDIQTLLHVHSSKVHVVPLAASETKTTTMVSRKVKTLYHLPDKYILYVGDVNWNKNVLGLIKAFNQLNDPNVHLVLVGKVFHDLPNIPEFNSIMSAIQTGPKNTAIHTLGYIPSHHLGSIYQLASLYCQPSFDEGFGLPLLEAMRSGCPVVSSNRGSLLEVGGDAPYYFDPETDDLTQIFQTILASPLKRTQMIAAGHLQSKQFSWVKTAALTKAVYSQVLSL